MINKQGDICKSMKITKKKDEGVREMLGPGSNDWSNKSIIYVLSYLISLERRLAHRGLGLSSRV